MVDNGRLSSTTSLVGQDLQAVRIVSRDYDGLADPRVSGEYKRWDPQTVSLAPPI